MEEEKQAYEVRYVGEDEPEIGVQQVGHPAEGDEELGFCRFGHHFQHTFLVPFKLGRNEIDFFEAYRIITNASVIEDAMENYFMSKLNVDMQRVNISIKHE